jgi:hypothetical protein
MIHLSGHCKFMGLMNFGFVHEIVVSNTELLTLSYLYRFKKTFRMRIYLRRVTMVTNFRLLSQKTVSAYLIVTIESH